MDKTMFMPVDEVMEVLGVSESYAYKLIRSLNQELAKTGYVTIPGRIDRKFFYEHFYGTQNYEYACRHFIRYERRRRDC